MEWKTVARMRCAFGTKFGVPRQSGLADLLPGTIVFEPEYRRAEALRGLEGFSHVWLLWLFSENIRADWSPTVRPPRLGGNERLGVFATRSPFRPNPIGLSCARLEGVELHTEDGPVLRVSGADLMDGTPILDIKPYVPYADCRPEAREAFAPKPEKRLKVVCAPGVCPEIPGLPREILENVLSWDPRPSYQNDPRRVYGMTFAGREIRFSVDGETLTVLEIEAPKP